MATVNMDSIYKKVQAYSKTKAGKEKMRQAIEYKRDHNEPRTGCGDEILTRAKMVELANELIDVIKSTAASYDLASSVMRHFESLNFRVQDIGKGKYSCEIYFSDDMSRESLDAGEYTGDGINNIVALFNNGYVASAPKYGWWNGHMATGESLYRSGTFDGNYAYIKGTQARPSLHFMQQAISSFVGKYKGVYPLNVLLNESIYDGNYAGSLNGTITKL